MPSRFLRMIGLKKGCLALALVCGVWGTHAQVTGGKYSMAFLKMPNAPHISALGGINIANPEKDISFVLQNPSLMRPSLHNQLGLNYNNYYAGIKVMNLNYGFRVDKLDTDFFLGIQYLNYGEFTATDASGNSYGNFRARDYAVTVGASRAYKERWRYGGALKWAHSHLYDRTSAALLMDFGINYMDTANHITVGMVAKNIGFVAKKYNPALPAEPLPFDLQLGISKRFKHLPLRLMATLHHLYEWDIRYDNPADIEGSTFLGPADSSGGGKQSHFADKLFRHFIFAGELTLAKRLTIIISYNHMRRGELKIKDKAALAGFAFGASLYLNKFQVHYGRSYYHVSGAYNEIGLNFNLNQLFHVGGMGDKINWNASYPGW